MSMRTVVVDLEGMTAKVIRHDGWGRTADGPQHKGRTYPLSKATRAQRLRMAWWLRHFVAHSRHGLAWVTVTPHA
ncbi:MAG TPA: hypothetical protein VJA25_00145 [Dehalococcoidia bacterium]|nr:hypothetical protein [Dehalococcoidia bacterium]